MEEIGIELWLLVERLAKKAPSTLVREISYRTNEPPQTNVAQLGMCNTVSNAKNTLKLTNCYASLKRRYTEMCDRQATRQNLRMIKTALKEEFRAGVSADDTQTEEDLLNFVQDTAERAIADVSPSFSTERYPQCWEVFAKCLVGAPTITGDQLIQYLDRFVLTPNLAPPKWWMDDMQGLSVVYKLTKIAMVKDPPTMELQYEVRPSDSPHKLIEGRRVLHLEEELQSSTQPAALALVGRKLAQSHGFLFHACVNSPATSPTRKANLDNSILRKTSADAEILKLLTKLHQLVKFGRVASPTKPGVGIGFGPSSGIKPPLPSSATIPPSLSSTVNGAGGAAASSSSESAPQKADVGLLYRDPEAALKNVDLNSADDYTIQEFKAKMTEGFSAKVVKPGDPGYKYDLRVQMKPTGASDWDSDDD